MAPPTSRSKEPPSFGNTQSMQEFMRTNGLLAIRRQGVTVVRDDMRMNEEFVKHATRRFRANPMMVQAPGMFQCSFQCDDGFQGAYDGIEIGPVSTSWVYGAELGLASYGDTIDGYLDWLFAVSYPQNTYYYGPTYIMNAPNSPNCLGEELAAIGSALVA